MASKRRVVRLDGTVVEMTITERYNIVGPSEAASVRERRFKLADCPRYQGCLRVAAIARIEFMTCRGCRGARGRWMDYARADNAKHGGLRPSIRKSKSCKTHGVELVKTTDNPRARPTCPVCNAEQAERMRKHWQDPEAKAALSARWRDYWTPERRQEQRERMQAYNERRRVGDA